MCKYYTDTTLLLLQLNNGVVILEAEKTMHSCSKYETAWLVKSQLILCAFNRNFFEGLKMRKRVIVREPVGGMESCPHLGEAIPCDEPTCYSWQLLKLEDCVPSGERECGPGTQLPQIQCGDSDGKDPLEMKIHCQ